MSRKRYKEQAAKRESGSFVALPHIVLRSAQFAALSPRATKLLMLLVGQYRGNNNGDLCAAKSVMAKRGWTSGAGLSAAIKELVDRRFLVVTRQGWRHKASLYALTWYEVDWCAGKLDVTAPTRAFLGAWSKAPETSTMAPKIDLPAPPAGQLIADYPTRGSIRLVHRGNCPARGSSQHTFRSFGAPPVGTFLEVPMSPSPLRMAA